VHGAYWALAENDATHCGVTVHLVDAGIDTGGILAQSQITPTARDNFATYGMLQTAIGLRLLRDVVLPRLLAGDRATQPAPARAEAYSARVEPAAERPRSESQRPAHRRFRRHGAGRHLHE